MHTYLLQQSDQLIGPGTLGHSNNTVSLCRDVKRVGDKKIYLMTDAGSAYSDDQLDQICNGLKAQSVELIVV